MIHVRSFAVFDTVLTHAIGGRDAFLAVVADRIAPEQDLRPAVVRPARARAERRLSERNGRPPALDEIWAEAADDLNQPAGVGARWARAEERIARELSVLIPGATELLDEARREGDSLVFVADTPYAAHFVGELLDLHGARRPGERVFTSADEGVSASAGGLYRAVGVRLGPVASVLHTSAHRRDVAAARLEGWDAVRAPQGALTRYERLLARHDTSSDHVASWLAGASRIARLEAVVAGVPITIAAVASAVMGPLLVGYVLWIAGRARRDGVERLYFVARDGKVIMRIAEQLLGSIAPELELRYLYASRLPWTLAASATSEAIRRNWVTMKSGSTARSLLSRVAIAPEDAFAASGLACFDPARADQPLTAAERAAAAEALMTGPLGELLQRSATATAEVTAAYLRQEGFLDGRPIALVDTGWAGRTAAALDEVVEQMDGAQVRHYLVGLTTSPPGTRNDRVVPWLLDHERDVAELAGFHNANVVIGMFCGGLEGRTLGYRTVGGHVEPVLAAARNEEVERWGLLQAQDVAVRVAELVAPHLSPHATHIDTRPFVWDVLRRFWLRPTGREIREWGSFPFETEKWPAFSPIAQRVTTAAVVRELRAGDVRMRSSSTWRAATEAVSAQPWRTVLAVRSWQDANRARLGRIPRGVLLALASRNLLRRHPKKPQ
jgi:hypothetical protein